ncbi:MAG: hypothetical protein AAFS12_04035 [Cyanobacteria bacterium J06632_19]
MSRSRRNHVDIDYSDGAAIVPTTRLQGMLNQVQQQGGVVNQQPGIPISVDSQPVEVRYVSSQTSYMLVNFLLNGSYTWVMLLVRRLKL